MFEKLKAAWNRLAEKSGAGEPTEAAIDYKGYRIRAAPYRADGLYQTAGIIEKDEGGGIKQHRFVRADTHQTREAAIAFTISKAKQIIDLQGDRIFAGERMASGEPGETGATG
ncbi:MAG: HlyU family transcriptional regulator [Xanthobacteraceae bacterium]